MKERGEEKSRHSQQVDDDDVRTSNNYKGDYQPIESCDSNPDNCELGTFNRVRYFTGQLLVPDDLLQEQAYFNGKRHLINRIVSGSGIVCGLGLESLRILHQDSQYLEVQIGGGFAIDGCGKEIIVKDDEEPKRVKTEDLFDEATTATRRLGLFLTREDIPSSPVPIYLTSSSNKLSASREKESFRLILKPIDESPVRFEFDKASYCIDDKVMIELWDPDKTLFEPKYESAAGEEQETETTQYNDVKEVGQSDEKEEEKELDTNKALKVKVKVFSKKDQTGIEVFLFPYKPRKEVDVYRGEITLTSHGASAEDRLLVHENDRITAKINDNIIEYAYVNSSNSFLLDERKMLNNYYDRKMTRCNGQDNGISKVHDSHNNEHGVLIAILKTKTSQESQAEEEMKQSLFVDYDESQMLRQVVYNNTLLYDLAKENRTCLREDRKISRTTILSDIYELDIERLRPNCYIITYPVRIFDENDPLYTNRKLEFPPIIYLGRTTYEHHDKVMYFEDFDYDIVINNKKYKPNTQQDSKLTKDTNLSLMQSISFKPIDVTSNSFRLIITKDYETEDNTKKLVLRWWALCNFVEK